MNYFFTLYYLKELSLRNNKGTIKSVRYFQLITLKPIFWIHGLLFFISVKSHSKITYFLTQFVLAYDLSFSRVSSLLKPYSTM